MTILADNARDKFWRKAYPEVAKRLKFLPERKLNANLEFAAGNLADAYRIGAEEAQTELLSRLRILQGKLTAESSSVTQEAKS